MVNSKLILDKMEVYERRVGASFFSEWSLKQFPFVILLKDGSISTYGVEDRYIFIGPTSGRKKDLWPIYRDIAKSTGAAGLRTETRRNPKAYSRLTGARLMKTVPYADGTVSYIMQLEV